MSMSKWAERGSQQLGLTYCKAVGILKNRMVFSFLEKLGLDTCIRCGKKLTAEDWSLDHIEPWVDVSPELFWDENNIGFAHKLCNRLAVRRNIKPLHDAARTPAAQKKRTASIRKFHQTESAERTAFKKTMSAKALQQWANGNLGQNIPAPEGENVASTGN